MSFIEKRFYRKDKVVYISFNSGLGTATPIYPFRFGCENQENAEMLKNQMIRELEKYKTELCKDPHYYLKPVQISQLKKKLNNWHAGINCWK